MKRRIPNILSSILIALIIVGVFGHVAHAQSAAPSFWGIPTFGELMTQALSTFINWMVMGMGFILALAGWLLNFSINLTLHIKEFVSSTPAIYTTWKALRDISGIFIIFALLYAAIELILDINTSKFGSLIKNVVIVGLLINFSFFFAGLGIDASNIVSVQLYNAIAPANSLNSKAATSNIFDNTGGTSFKNLDGGLSDIFMSSLKIQSLSQSSLSAAAANNAAGSKAPPSALIIFFSGIVAVMIEFVAALSFVAAAGAFIFRFVILLLLLAFSPIWIAARIIPQVQEYSKDWVKQYTAMLTFMPAYLLLMYLALNVLTSNPNGLFGMVNSTGVVGNGAWYSSILVLGVNAFLVCFLLNMPLVVAAKMGGMAAHWIEKSGFNGGTVWKKFGSQAGSRTLGRAAYAANDSRPVRWLASKSPLIGGLVSNNLTKVTKTGFGDKKGSYENRLKEKSKMEEGLHKKLGTIDKSRYDNKIKDVEGKTQLDRAQAQAKNDQKSYRENLPWTNAFTGKPGGVIGFMVDNRANRQTAAKLNEETGKKDLLKQEKDIRKQRKDLQDELDALEARIDREAKPVGFTPGKTPSPSDLSRKKEIADKIAEYDKKLDDIEETKETTRIEKIAGGVAEKSKGEGGGGGGDGDKKEDKH